jgi:hypothetical protein
MIVPVTAYPHHYILPVVFPTTDSAIMELTDRRHITLITGKRCFYRQGG